MSLGTVFAIFLSGGKNDMEKDNDATDLIDLLYQSTRYFFKDGENLVFFVGRDESVLMVNVNHKIIETEKLQDW